MMLLATYLILQLLAQVCIDEDISITLIPGNKIEPKNPKIFIIKGFLKSCYIPITDPPRLSILLPFPPTHPLFSPGTRQGLPWGVLRARYFQ